MPFELVDGVLEETGARERRLRLRWPWSGLLCAGAWAVLEVRLPGVWAKLTATLDGLGLAAPSAKGAAGPAPATSQQGRADKVRDDHVRPGRRLTPIR